MTAGAVLAIAVLCIAIGALVTWLLMRNHPQGVAPGSTQALQAIAAAGVEAQEQAHKDAAAIATAPQSVIDARVEALRERGRSGK